MKTPVETHLLQIAALKKDFRNILTQIHNNVCANCEEKIKQKYVMDDLDELWYYNESTGRIKLVGDPTPDGGYYCENFEEGVALLNEYGYITQ